MEAKSKYSPNIKPYLKTHDIIDSVDGFSHITLNYNILPPIKIKTKPSIFIMKRKSNIKYDLNKAKLWVSMKDFPEQVDDTENIGLKILHETTKIMEPILKDISESLEEFGQLEETDKHNFSPEIQKINEIIDQTDEEVKKFDNFVDIGMTSVENITEINDIDESLPSLKNKKEEFDYQNNFEDVIDSDNVISDGKFDESKIEKGKIIKGKLKNNFNSRQENHGIKEMVKKIIQEKMLEVKQKREVNEEREIMEHIIESMMEMKTRITDEPKTMKKASEETSAYRDKLKEVAKDENKQKVMRTKNVTWKMDKIKKPVVLEETVKAKYTMEQKDEVMDKMMKKNTKIHDRINTESSTKPTNVRESIRNIINQFKEFEKDFMYDDTDSATSINDINNVNHIEEKSRIEKDNVIVNHPVETEDQLVIKDARESLKEILDQFKHIRHELTSEEDDQFDEIAATYLERPIAETLLKFSEALKSLMQQRKKISLHGNNLYDDKPRMTILENQDLMTEEIMPVSTEYAKETKIIENGHKNGKSIIAKIKSKDKQSSESIVNGHDPDGHDVVSNTNKYIDAQASTEDVSLNAQRYNNTILNNTNKADSMRKESSQNIENDKSD